MYAAKRRATIALPMSNIVGLSTATSFRRKIPGNFLQEKDSATCYRHFAFPMISTAFCDSNRAHFNDAARTAGSVSTPWILTSPTQEPFQHHTHVPDMIEHFGCRLHAFIGRHGPPRTAPPINTATLTHLSVAVPKTGTDLFRLLAVIARPSGSRQSKQMLNDGWYRSQGCAVTEELLFFRTRNGDRRRRCHPKHSQCARHAQESSLIRDEKKALFYWRALPKARRSRLGLTVSDHIDR